MPTNIPVINMHAQLKTVSQGQSRWEIEHRANSQCGEFTSRVPKITNHKSVFLGRVAEVELSEIVLHVAKN